MIETQVDPGLSVHQSGRVVILALLLGIAADVLVLRQGMTGAGFLLWMVLMVGAGQLLSRPERRSWLPSCWSVFALMAAFLLFVRSTPVLVPMMLLVLLSCSINWVLQQRTKDLSGITVLDYPWTALRMPVLFLQSLRKTAGRVNPALVPQRSVRGVIRGLVLALPLVVIFALLFASADARFSGYLSSATNIFSVTAVEHLVTVSLMSVLTFGLLAMVVCKPDPGQINVPRQLRLGREETLVIMGSLVLLFLVFVVLQAGYLFGGREVIEQTSGLTLAEHARRGFFEMLVVAVLTLLVLLALSGLCCDLRFFRPLAAVMVALVLSIMVSALQRLLLYVEAFGLTIDRLLALGVMLWLAGSLVGFVFTVLRGRPQGFAFGSVVFATVLLLAAGIVNPAAIVTQTNITRVVDDTDRSIDVHYLTGLGGDAVPVILARFDELPESLQCQLSHALMGWLNMPEQSNWRQWNRSRAAALRAVDQNRETLEAIVKQDFADLMTRVSPLTRGAIFRAC